MHFCCSAFLDALYEARCPHVRRRTVLLAEVSSRASGDFGDALSHNCQATTFVAQCLEKSFLPFTSISQSPPWEYYLIDYMQILEGKYEK